MINFKTRVVGRSFRITIFVNLDVHEEYEYKCSKHKLVNFWRERMVTKLHHKLHGIGISGISCMSQKTKIS